MLKTLCNHSWLNLHVHRKFKYPAFFFSYKKLFEQECIPVGCVPAARRPYSGVCFPGGGSAWSGGVLPGRGVVPCSGEGGSPWSGGVCLVQGGLPWSGGRGSAWSGGVLPWSGGGWGLPGPRGSPWSGGFSLSLGGVLPAWRPPPWTESQTHVKT